MTQTVMSAAESKAQCSRNHKDILFRLRSTPNRIAQYGTSPCHVAQVVTHETDDGYKSEEDPDFVPNDDSASETETETFNDAEEENFMDDGDDQGNISLYAYAKELAQTPPETAYLGQRTMTPGFPDDASDYTPTSDEEDAEDSQNLQMRADRAARELRKLYKRSGHIIPYVTECFRGRTLRHAYVSLLR